MELSKILVYDGMIVFRADSLDLDSNLQNEGQGGCYLVRIYAALIVYQCDQEKPFIEP